MATTTTGCSSRALNRRPRIMASAMSVTCSSSKQISRASVRQRLGDVRDRIARHLLRAAADAVVHLGHELVEMHAPLGAKADRLEEQVHQHGLAASDGAKNIEPLGRRRGAAEQACKTGASRRQSPNASATASSLAAAAACAGSASITPLPTRARYLSRRIIAAPASATIR